MKLKTKAECPARSEFGSRQAVSLIEVVVAIFIAGSLLVSTLLTMAACARQARQTQLGRVGVETTDRFLWLWSSHDFRDTGLEPSMRLAGLEFARMPSLPSDTIAVGLGKDLSLRVKRISNAECQKWNMQKIGVEALSIPNRKLIMKLEIVREASHALRP